MKRKVYNHGFYDYYYKCQECGCESISLRQLGGLQPPDLICDNCGLLVVNNKINVEEKSDREKALEWWNKLDLDKRNLIYMNYMGTLNSGRSLKGYEVEQIWRKETQQDSLNSYSDLGDEMFALPKKERPQVDFEMLRDGVEDTIILMSENMVSDGYINNFKLFFELLSKSSTFAHKAHKELNKLSNK